MSTALACRPLPHLRGRVGVGAGRSRLLIHHGFASNAPLQDRLHSITSGFPKDRRHPYTPIPAFPRKRGKELMSDASTCHPLPRKRGKELMIDA